jgi:cytidylate kinase
MIDCDDKIDPMIIGIAGPIASGKSTLARGLAQVFSLKLIGFGEYVRHEAQARGLDVADRRVLQDLGQSLGTRAMQESR